MPAWLISFIFHANSSSFVMAAWNSGCRKILRVYPNTVGEKLRDQLAMFGVCMGEEIYILAFYLPTGLVQLSPFSYTGIETQKNVLLKFTLVVSGRSKIKPKCFLSSHLGGSFVIP